MVTGLSKELTVKMVEEHLFNEFGKHVNFKGINTEGNNVTLLANDFYTVEDWDIYCFSMMHTTKLFTGHAIKIASKRF